ncbi:unnamed protein product [Urochloa humidicola]
MGNMVWRLGNATSSVNSTHHPSDLWKGPRGTVLRIQALAVVAITTTFFLIAFGSCRRWSNRWLVQKGFFAAQVLSLSLGTYGIGLMQSSSVKSEMYPIWTVSLFTIFGCIDPVTSYNGLDYKGTLSKVVYGIFLHCGYVLLMSLSTVSGIVGNTAIGVLAAVTFVKSFHMSLALLQQSRMRNMVQNLDDRYHPGETLVLRYSYSADPASLVDVPRHEFEVDIPTDTRIAYVTIRAVNELLREKKDDQLQSCYDACVAYCLSHRLQRDFLGLNSRKVDHPPSPEGIDYKWALKVIEIELALLFDVFFTGNAFHHYYQAKTASLWALASFTGICFVGAAVAIPGAMTSRHPAAASTGVCVCTKVLHTTTADLVITFVILASLALLQLLQLFRCWTSNWARIAVVCAYTRNDMRLKSHGLKRPCWQALWMRLKLSVASGTNWFDRYLWQCKIAQYQYSTLPEPRPSDDGKKEVLEGDGGKGQHRRGKESLLIDRLCRGCVRLVKLLAMDYIWEVLWDLLGSDANKRAAIKLDDDVKASIIEFLGTIKSDRTEGDWLSFAQDQRIGEFLPYTYTPHLEPEPDGFRYTRCVMAWCLATWYCELAELEQEELKRKQQDASSKAKGWCSCCCCKKAASATASGGENRRKHRLVANALSKYCAYLVVSLPELLPGPVPETTRAYDSFVKAAREARDKEALLKALLDRQYWSLLHTGNVVIKDVNNHANVGGDPPILDLMRRPDPWATLADVWVRMLVYAAPYGSAEAHMRQLSQGGELVTHLWALLCHLSIREWKLPGNLHDVATVDQAQKILGNFFHEEEGVLLTEDNHVIAVAFLDSLHGSYSDELAAAAKLEERVSFYRTTSPEIAEIFHIDPAAAKLPSLVLLMKEPQQFTLYDGEFKRYAIADFVSTNKLPLVPTLVQKTVSSLDGHPIKKLIILLAVANESSKFLPMFREAAKSFKGKLLFFFLERDSEEGKQAARLLYIPSTGGETTVLAYTTDDKREIPLNGELTLDTIKKFAQDFFEDKLYISGEVPESNDEDVKIVVGKNIDQTVLDESKDVLLVIYHPMYHPDQPMETTKELAKLLSGIDSLVIAKMNGFSNWHPRAKLRQMEFFKILFYPAGRKRYEPIPFEGSSSSGVVDYYKFIKKHAGIPFEPVSALEQASSGRHGATETEIEEIPH